MDIKNKLDEIIQSQTMKDIVSLFDEGTFTAIDNFISKGDDITAVISGYGCINGSLVYAFAQNPEFDKGVMNKAAAMKISRIYQMAAKTGTPVVGFYASNGGAIDEGMDVLGVYGDIVKSAAKVSGVVLQIAVINGVCAGAMSMIACMSDFVIMTEKAELFMTPPFLTANDKQGNIDNMVKSGVVCASAKDTNEAVSLVKSIIGKMPANNLSPLPIDEYEFEPKTITTDSKGIDLIKLIADDDSVTPLYEKQGKSSCTAIGTIKGITTAFVATNKADSKLSSDDCAKIARFVMTCDSFSVPVVTIIDCEGFEAQNGSEIRNQAKLAAAYANATVTKIGLITGKAYGSAFIAMSSNDFTLAWESAVISPLNPAAMVEFLQSDKIKLADNLDKKRAELEKEYAVTDAGPYEAAARGFVDMVIEPENTRDVLSSALDMLSSKRENNMPRKHANIPF